MFEGNYLEVTKGKKSLQKIIHFLRSHYIKSNYFVVFNKILNFYQSNAHTVYHLCSNNIFPWKISIQLKLSELPSVVSLLLYDKKK